MTSDDIKEIGRALDKALREARTCARVLAHAYDHDSRPPDWALEMARQWDAHGRGPEDKGHE